MSTILKALRRLEQERAKDGERPLREEVVLARPRRRGPWAAWAVTGVALAVGFGATWLVLGSLGEATRSPDATPPVAAAAPSTPEGGDASSPDPVPPSPPPAAPTPTVRVAAGAPSPVAAPAPMPAPAAGEPVRSAAPARPPVPPPVEPTPPRVAAAPPPRAPAPPPVVSREEPVLTAPIPGRAPRFVDDDEAGPRAPDVPVDVVRTSWHPLADRRSAWVAIGGESPREVREGEWVGAYEVRSIEPDGVLFADGPLLVHRPVGQ